jgi:probable F420-dependent oxidoreductase
MSQLLIDAYLPTTTGPIQAPEAVAQAALRGFDGVFSAETAHDPFLQLAAGIPSGPGMTFGTAIAVAFPRSPMTTAMMAWDLQAQSDGNFILGLGTQVRAHIQRRFSTVWDSPGPRLREYVAALHAIWDTWQDGAPLRFKGDFYQFTLMAPFFDPGPLSYDRPKVFISAVGPYNCRLVGEVCDGMHVHPFHTIKYLDEHVLPHVSEGAQLAGRDMKDITLSSTVFCVTGSNEKEMEASRTAAKQQIAFYASTPAYRRVLEIEGWEFGPELTAMSKRGKWTEMGALISDDVLETVAVVAPIDELGAAVNNRYRGKLGRLGFYTLGDELSGLSPEQWSQLISTTRA